MTYRAPGTLTDAELAVALDLNAADGESIDNMVLYEAAERIRDRIPIPVTERLPEEDQEVLFWVVGGDDWYRGVFAPEGVQFEGSQRWWERVEVAKFNVAGRMHHDFTVTHWLPLPPAPEQPTCFFCGQPYMEEWGPALCSDGETHLICTPCNTGMGRIRVQLDLGNAAPEAKS